MLTPPACFPRRSVYIGHLESSCAQFLPVHWQDLHVPCHVGHGLITKCPAAFRIGRRFGVRNFGSCFISPSLGRQDLHCNRHMMSSDCR
jgi:hypothetical protein